MGLIEQARAAYEAREAEKLRAQEGLRDELARRARHDVLRALGVDVREWRLAGDDAVIGQVEDLELVWARGQRANGSSRISLVRQSDNEPLDLVRMDVSVAELNNEDLQARTILRLGELLAVNHAVAFSVDAKETAKAEHWVWCMVHGCWHAPPGAETWDPAVCRTRG